MTSSAPAEYLDLVAAFGIDMAAKVAKFTQLNVEKVYEIAKDIKESEIRLVEGVTSYFDSEALQHSKLSIQAFEAALPEYRGRYDFQDSAELEENYGVRGTCGGIVGPAGAMWPYRVCSWNHYLHIAPCPFRPSATQVCHR